MYARTRPMFVIGTCGASWYALVRFCTFWNAFVCSTYVLYTFAQDWERLCRSWDELLRFYSVPSIERPPSIVRPQFISPFFNKSIILSLLSETTCFLKDQFLSFLVLKGGLSRQGPLYYKVLLFFF